MAVAGSAHAVVDPRVANVGLPTHEPVAVHRVASRNQRVGAVGRQAHLRARNARGHTPTHIECDLRQRDGVGRWARIVVGISHMALVIRVVQVAAVPALREPQLQGNRFARRTVRNHETIGVAGEISPLAVEAVVARILRRGRGGMRIARDHSQAIGHRLNQVGGNATTLVIEDRVRRRDRRAVGGIDQAGNPIRRAVDRATCASGVAGVKQRVRGGIGIRFSVAEERVQVRAAGLVRVDDGIVIRHVRILARNTKCTGVRRIGPLVGRHHPVAGKERGRPCGYQRVVDVRAIRVTWSRRDDWAGFPAFGHARRSNHARAENDRQLHK
jgi:hypothetical protein